MSIVAKAARDVLYTCCSMHNQNGSLHLGIIGILTIALIVVLGMLFWQNFGPKTKTDNSQAVVSPSPSKSVAAALDEPDDLTANTHADKANIWAGFVVDSAAFTAVEGRVKVPTVTCTSNEQAFGAWVGFDGWNTQTVEQVGVNATCDNASAYLKTPAINGVYYYAWAAMHGAGSYENFDIVIKPGDVIYSKASYANGKFTLYVKNETTGQNGTNVQSCKVPDGFHEATGDCPRTHAEWIVERPGSNQLANFGKVTLYDNKVTTAGGKTGYIEWFPNTLVDMIQGSTRLSYTSNLREKGTFDVSWIATGKTGD